MDGFIFLSREWVGLTTPKVVKDIGLHMSIVVPNWRIDHLLTPRGLALSNGFLRRDLTQDELDALPEIVRQENDNEKCICTPRVLITEGCHAFVAQSVREEGKVSSKLLLLGFNSDQTYVFSGDSHAAERMTGFIKASGGMIDPVKITDYLSSTRLHTGRQLIWFKTDELMAAVHDIYRNTDRGELPRDTSLHLLEFDINTLRKAAPKKRVVRKPVLKDAIVKAASKPVTRKRKPTTHRVKSTTTR